MTAACVRFETGFQAQHRQRDLRLRQGERLRPGGDVGEVGEPVVGQHVAHAIARAVAPQRDRDPLALALQRLRMLDHGVEHVGVLLGALGREVAAGARADIDHALPLPAPRTASAAPAPTASSRAFHSLSVR